MITVTRACVVTNNSVRYFDEYVNGIIFIYRSILTPSQHHCRNCGILVCHKCSSNKAVVKSVHPTNPTRVCDNCYDILEGALAAAGQVTGRALGAIMFDTDDTEDNDDESDFERLHLSSDELRENLMKSAAGK